MEEVIIINDHKIKKTEIDKIKTEIIEILSQKNITHAIAYMILDETKNELQNTIVKKSV